jgi:hypothetical protein
MELVEMGLAFTLLLLPLKSRSGTDLVHFLCKYPALIWGYSCF